MQREELHPTRHERIAGGLYGLLVGDALGVPYEFNPPSALPAREFLEMQPPVGFRRSHSRVPPGTWSDDGAMALCLLSSLLEHDQLNVADLAQKFLRWYQKGYMTPDGKVFDVGVQTGRSLRKIRYGEDPLTTGEALESSNGNGSLMRVLPLVLWHQGSDEELVRLAQAQSCVTHRHVRSQVCCALYCLWARFELKQEEQCWQQAVAALRAMYSEESEERAELEFHIRPDDAPEGIGSGYVVDCLRSARMVCEQENTYEGTVKAAIALGKDTDTTACVAGGIAGIRYGKAAIPERWLAALQAKESIVEPILAQLLSKQDAATTHPPSAEG
jgi:ADP-ribosyl-[dinitrogen reductase] hydrolase